jgi:predicted XRE-type DNA-binding protein
MVRDLLALQLDTSPAEIGEVEITPVLDTALADEVSQTRHAREQADKLRAEATAQTRRTALHLKEQGLAQRDISTLLRLSHQAVSQLLAG